LHFRFSFEHRRPRLYLPAPACAFLITREGRKHWDQNNPDLAYVTQNYPRSPARMMPYNSQNNDTLIKELKFALKSVREWENSAKIYARARFAVQKAEVVEQLKIHSTLIGQRISTKNLKCLLIFVVQSGLSVFWVVRRLPLFAQQTWHADIFWPNFLIPSRILERI
jgi:hypothetical protein